MSNSFSNPPAFDVAGDFTQNPIYSIGSTVDVAWSTDYDLYSVYLWQQSLQQGSAVVSQPIFVKIGGADEPGGFSWQVDSGGFDLGQSNVFFMAIGPNNTLQGSFESHYFNLTAAAAASPTTDVSSTSSVATSSATAISSTGSRTDSSTRNIGLILGLALGLGIPILLLLCFLAFKVTKRRQQPRSPSPGGIQVVSPHSKTMQVAPTGYKPTHSPQLVELDQGRQISQENITAVFPRQADGIHGNRVVELPGHGS